MAKYADYNSFYTHTLLAQTKSNHSAYDESAGSELMLDDDYHGVPAIDREAGFIVDARARRYLDRIVDLARSREIRITVFSAPIYRDPRFKDYVQESRAYIASYCQALGIPFIDFTEADFDRSEFRDYNHLNGRGALRLTGMLADSLLELETKPLP
jgi:lysophospholipase L1-like esterase